MHTHPVGTGFFPAARIGVVLGILIGVGGIVVDRLPAAVTTPPVTLAMASELRGPHHVEQLALRGPLVVHVWLEGCQDCMPAFAAYRSLKESGAFDDMRELHVAYGRATPEFAKRWRVDDNLVFDEGGHTIVRPWRINSFTTVVLDKQGMELLRTRPDAPMYAENVRRAFMDAVAQ